jgi:hypothetical protein
LIGHNHVPVQVVRESRQIHDHQLQGASRRAALRYLAELYHEVVEEARKGSEAIRCEDSPATTMPVGGGNGSAIGGLLKLVRQAIDRVPNLDRPSSAITP